MKAIPTANALTPKQLRARIHELEAEPPITVAFERNLAMTTASLRMAWYRHQKEHWLGWLRHYNGPGYYGRKSWNVSAERVYNRANNPAMVLWLGEAAGLPTVQVEEAAAAAKSAGPSFPSQCAAIRRIIPWRDIEPLIVNRKPVSILSRLMRLRLSK